MMSMSHDLPLSYFPFLDAHAQNHYKHEGGEAIIILCQRFAVNPIDLRPLRPVFHAAIVKSKEW